MNAANHIQHATNSGKQVNWANWRRILWITSGTRFCWWCFHCLATHSPCILATTAGCTLVARSEGAPRRECCRNNKPLWLVELVLGVLDGPPLLEVMVRGREEILFCNGIGMIHMLIWIGRSRVTVGDYLVGHRGRVHAGEEKDVKKKLNSGLCCAYKAIKPNIHSVFDGVRAEMRHRMRIILILLLSLCLYIFS